MKRNQKVANRFETKFCFEQERIYFDFSSSIHLPVRESEYMERMLKKGWKLRHFLKYLLKKYNDQLLKNSPKNYRIRKRIQTRTEKKTRFCFRPDAQSWVEVQMLSLGLGISCCMVIIELIRLEMDQDQESSLNFTRNRGRFSKLKSFRKKFFTFKYNPNKKTIHKIYSYQRFKRD